MNLHVATLIQRTAEANSALIRGDVDRYLALIEHAEDYTLMAPFGGAPTRGFDTSSEYRATMARFFKSGTFGQEVVATYDSGDLIVLVTIEWVRAEVGGLPEPSTWRGPRRTSCPKATDRQDEENPIMNMGLVPSTNCHTAFDSDVVFHEFVHGVTNRLVGGRLNDQALRQPQSRGQGERVERLLRPHNTKLWQTHGEGSHGRLGLGRVGGIRGFPYNSSFPDGFGSLGSGRYTGKRPDGRPSPHPIGEIWCATLMQINRAVGEALGNQDRAYQLCWQLVVDGLKLSPSNPSFLDSRNSILQALDDMKATGRLPAPQHATIRRVMWQTFANFGMGVNASSNGASVLGIVADKTLPADLQPGPIQP